jgi:hypothetical protein
MKQNYTLLARTYPVLLTCLPILVVGVSYGLQLREAGHILASFGVTGALFFLLSQFGRNRGKLKEPGLWAEWGGPPTIQILRHSNDYLDMYTKRKYHNRLSQLSGTNAVVNEKYEMSNPQKSDDIYQSWARFMISKTRDKTKFSLLFDENINYGFRRNLWGLKPYAIVLIAVCVLGNFLYQLFSLGIERYNHWPAAFYVCEGMLIVVLIIWISVFTKHWVKVAAFAYAERLFELVEQIE